MTDQVTTKDYDFSQLTGLIYVIKMLVLRDWPFRVLNLLIIVAEHKPTSCSAFGGPGVVWNIEDTGFRSVCCSELKLLLHLVLEAGIVT
jgi:hypothetical protein